ncbi:hypothetical protein FACS1894156_2560 [Bacteroidia bacterium]|nr:hypothetical protein FACS1894156_2560 [Bacteroidia bacterium]
MKPNKIAGIVATVVFHAALLLLLLLWGYPIPFPPPPEEGMFINFGNSDVGSGYVEPMQQPAPARPVVAQPAPDEEEETLTQDYEDAPVVVKKKSPSKQEKKSRETIAEPVETAPQEPPRTVNKNALFPGQSTQASNASTGEGEGAGAGNQGALEGAVNSTNRQGGSSGSYELGGRALSGTLPKPAYEVQESGKVIVNIRVDKSGRVVEAKVKMAGTTTTNSTLHRAAEEAALRAHFTAAADNAPAYQNGTIIYVFRLGQ